MPPKSLKARAKASATAKSDKAKAMRATAAAMEKAAKIQRIGQILRSRPDLCGPVQEALAAHEIQLDDDDDTFEGAAVATIAAGRSSSAASAGDDEEQEEDSTGLGDKIPRSETALEMLHISRITASVKRLEPLAFSGNNLKSLRPDPKNR